ncbi:CarD family transcriptional regulator [Neobacillus drentensis]|uniref:CarD family transcriptional regulator n=1 Tax=Neobacillus drentensis TaxID=220684 RepID=UPI002FFD7519
MFNIGDLVIYSIHGLSRIDDICEKTISNVTKTYYVLHPLDQANLIISAPVDSDKVVMQKMLDSEEAEGNFAILQPAGGKVDRKPETEI